MTYHYKALGLAAAVALSPMAASAATVGITITSYGSGNIGDPNTNPNIAGALAAQATFMLSSGGDIFSEDFDAPGDFTACPATGCSSTASGLETAVGTFNHAGSVGSGDPVDPTDAAVIKSAGDDANSMGRYNVNADTDNNHIGGKWLDSNDWTSVEWSIPGTSGLTDIDRIAFFLTDVNDSGNTLFDVSVDGTNLTLDTESITPAQSNGNLRLVEMLFSEAVTGNILIKMTNVSGDTSDGFGIDTIRVGGDLDDNQLTPVPLPASALLLLGGLGGLGGLSALRRRKRTA